MENKFVDNHAAFRFLWDRLILDHVFKFQKSAWFLPMRRCSGSACFFLSQQVIIKKIDGLRFDWLLTDFRLYLILRFGECGFRSCFFFEFIRVISDYRFRWVLFFWYYFYLRLLLYLILTNFLVRQRCQTDVIWSQRLGLFLSQFRTFIKKQLFV